MRLTTAISLSAAILLFIGCDAITPLDGDLVEYSCEGCHSSKSTLNRVIEALDLAPQEDDHAAPG